MKEANAIWGTACQNAAYLAAICDLKLRFADTGGGVRFGKLPGQTAAILRLRFGRPLRTWGGGKKRGEENFTNETNPKKWLWTRIVGCVCHPPLCRCSTCPCTKGANTYQTRRSFGGDQKFSGGCFFRYVFLPPHTFYTPPCHDPITKNHTQSSASLSICLTLRSCVYLQERMACCLIEIGVL